MDSPFDPAVRHFVVRADEQRQRCEVMCEGDLVVIVPYDEICEKFHELGACRVYPGSLAEYELKFRAWEWAMGEGDGQ